LIICDPVLATPIDPNEYYSDSLPDDGGTVSDKLDDAFDRLNEVIRKEKPLSWVPGKYAVDIGTLEAPSRICKKCSAETQSAFCHKCGASVLYVGAPDAPADSKETLV
jgi:ribosomal protein S27AE